MKYNFKNCNIETKQIGDNNRIITQENSSDWTDAEWEELKKYIAKEINSLSKESVRYEIAETVKKAVDHKDKVTLLSSLKKYAPTMVVNTLSGLTANGIIEVIKKVLS